MTFKQAVEGTPDIATNFKVGLTALGAYSSKVSVSDTSQLQGSVDIDSATTAKYPQDNRWDYAFAYKGEVFFIEVHSANTGEVSTVIRKLRWLKDWLNNQAPEINKLKSKTVTPFYWIQSNGFAILKTSRQYREAAQNNIMPKAILKID